MRRCFSIMGLLAIVLTLSSFALMRKSFKIIGPSVVVEHISVSAKVDISEVKIKNNTKEPVTLRWTRLSNTFPKGWDYSMCAYGQCQIGIPKGALLKTIEPGEEGFIAVHVLPKKHLGTGSVSFELVDVNNEKFVEIITFEVHVES